MMELWIRSQKNEKLRPLLLKVNEIEIGDYHVGMNCIVVNNLHCVGIYNSKERALEVLDEIQHKLLKSKYYRAKEDYGKHSDCKDTLIEISSSIYVYEMPKE